MGPCQLVGPLVRANKNALWPGQKKWRQGYWVLLTGLLGVVGAIFFCPGQRVFFCPDQRAHQLAWAHGIILNRYFVILINSLLCLQLSYYFILYLITFCIIYRHTSLGRAREANNFGICIFYIRLSRDSGKPANFILKRKNMRVPRPGDCAKAEKLRNVGF